MIDVKDGAITLEVIRSQNKSKKWVFSQIVHFSTNKRKMCFESKNYKNQGVSNLMNEKERLSCKTGHCAPKSYFCSRWTNIEGFMIFSITLLLINEIK